MDDTKYEIAFQLIMEAGNSKAESMSAIQAARQGDMEQANLFLKNAETEMRKAHQLQIDMIQEEAAGKPVDVNIILVHAQDHLTMAIMARDMAEEMIEMYRMCSEVKTLVKQEAGRM